METKFYNVGFVFNLQKVDGDLLYSGWYFNTEDNDQSIYPGNYFSWYCDDYDDFRKTLRNEVIRYIQPPEKYHITWVEMINQ